MLMSKFTLTMSDLMLCKDYKSLFKSRTKNSLLRIGNLKKEKERQEVSKKKKKGTSFLSSCHILHHVLHWITNLQSI